MNGKMTSSVMTVNELRLLIDILVKFGVRIGPKVVRPSAGPLRSAPSFFRLLCGGDFID
jgi:hypothetical protein